MEISEAKIRDQIFEYLMWCGIFAWRDRQVSRVARIGVKPEQRGVSDILAIWPRKSGRLLAIEVKKPGGRVSRDQSIFITSVRAQGGTAFIAHSVEEVVNQLTQGGQ